MKHKRKDIFAATIFAAMAATAPAHAQSVIISYTALTTKTANANVGIGVVTVTGPFVAARKYKLSLSGPDAAKFRLSSTIMPSVLKVGPANLPTGNYDITVVGTTP